MNITEQQLQEFMQEVNANGLEETVKKIKQAQQPFIGPDFDEQERAELAQVRQGDWRGINRVSEKYAKLRNPVVDTVRTDPELERAKGNNSLQQLYDQRVRKVRHGDVNSLVALKKAFREKGLEVY